MFGSKRFGPQWRIIDETDRVFCPRRRADVELERCLACTSLLDLDQTASPGQLRCDTGFLAEPASGGRAWYGELDS